jgi:hypothetical protein
MVIRKNETFPPVTMGHIRGHGCRNLLVYCISGRRHHSAVMDGDWLDNDMPVCSLCGRMVCTQCGMIGADGIGDRTSTSHAFERIARFAYGSFRQLRTCRRMRLRLLCAIRRPEQVQQRAGQNCEYSSASSARARRMTVRASAFAA